MSVAVVIYTTTYCGYCRAAKGLLQQQGIAYQEVDITHDQGARRWLARLTGQSTVPQLLVGDKPIGGYSELSALVRGGKLQAMVADPAAPPAEPPAAPPAEPADTTKS